MRKASRQLRSDALPCPAPLVFNMIGGKWKLSILQILVFRGTKRFGELRREIDGVTQTMLTNQLRALEEDGLVARAIFPEVPPRVEYSATKNALALTPMFEAMHQWWMEHGSAQAAESVGGRRKISAKKGRE